MKKYFLFAAVAGMLASCSSESLTGSDPKIEPTTQDDRVPIEIGVASAQTKASTRGTGTAGDLATGTNIWNGERINVLMYEIDATGETPKPTFIFTKDANGDELYDETISLVTPLTEENTATGIAKEPLSGVGAGKTYKVKYYPATGRSDFWGYYLGGYGYTPAPAAPAAGDAAGDGTLTMYEDAALATPTTTEANANYVATTFKIDGTHDLLVGKATSDNPNAYSAKAARAGVQPNITFKHVLTRLTFKAQAGNKDAADAQVKVTGIKVHSKTDGKLIVAYKADTEPERIVWDDLGTTSYTAYPDLALKERTSAVDRTLKALSETQLTWDAVNDKADVINIGEALLVAPQDKYYIEIDYKVSVKAAREWYKTAYIAVPNGALTAGKTYYTDNTGAGSFVAVGTEISGGTNYFTVSYPAVPDGTQLTDGKKYYTSAEGAGEFTSDGSQVSSTSGTVYYEVLYTPVPAGTLTSGTKYYKSDNTGSGMITSDGTEVAEVKNYYEANPYAPGDLTGDPATIQMPTYKATIPTNDAALLTEGFKAGHSYEIGFKLYGPEEIKITTTLTAWGDGGTDTIAAE